MPSVTRNKKYKSSGPPALKVKEYDISLTKNYCITISIQKITIHKFILKTADVRVTWTKKGTSIFDHAQPKIIESNFSFPEFVTACKKKKSSFHLFISAIKSILESHDQTSHIHFWPCPSNKFRISNFCESVSTCKKSVYSICSFYRYSRFQSDVTWLATTIFDQANLTFSVNF